jgi:hypothetical protein
MRMPRYAAKRGGYSARTDNILCREMKTRFGS